MAHPGASKRACLAGFFALVALVVVLPSPRAFADLGSLVAKGQAGPYHVSVLVTPSPLRVGPALFSLAVRNRATQNPVLDARILLIFEPPHDARAEGGHNEQGHEIQAEARPSESRHPGLASALVDLPTAGTWRARVRVRTTAGEGSFDFEVPVGPPRQPWIDYWAAFGLPVVGGLLFVWHQRRVLARTRKR